MVAFRSKEKAIQTLVLAHCADAIQAISEHLVHVPLMADIKDESVARSLKHSMKCDCQFDHSEIGAEMATGL